MRYIPAYITRAIASRKAQLEEASGPTQVITIGAFARRLHLRALRCRPKSVIRHRRAQVLIRSRRMRSTEAKWWYEYGLVGALCLLLAALSWQPSFAADPTGTGGKATSADSISIDGAVEHRR